MNDKKEVVQLNLNDIIPNRFQPREVFDEKALKELAVSIKEHGVIQPIIVREVNGKYEIIAGERRYKASALAGMTKIPAIIRDLDDKESSKVALLENLQRKNLNPIEEARTYQKILEIDQMTQEELAKTMGKSQSAVANKIRLLSLPDEIQEALLKEQISERHARTLLNIDDSKVQKELLEKVIADKLSVRKLEEEIKEIKGESNDVSDAVPSVNMFIDSNPLTPTAEVPKEVDNFGKVTVAPPEGEGDDTPMGKFINYGELDKEENNEEEEDSMPLMPPSSINPVDEVKEAENIPTNNSSADLDNLLNLSSINGKSNGNNYITEAEKIVKNDSTSPNEKIEDYFKTPDLNGFSLPQNSIVEDGEDSDNESDNVMLPPSNFELPEEVSIVDGIAKIKKFVDELKMTGLPITADEMDFEQSYQVIIKIDKE